MARISFGGAFKSIPPRTRLSIAQVLAVCGLIAIAVVIALAPFTLNKMGPARITPSPFAEATGTPGPTDTPAATPANASPEPAKVLASIDCAQKSPTSAPVVRDGVMYAICGNDVKVIDLATHLVTRTYAGLYKDPAAPASGGPATDKRTVVVDNALWIDDLWAQTVWRIDIQSGAVIGKYAGSLLEGDWGGKVWLNSATTSGSQAVDPATGAPGAKLPVADVSYCGGALWSLGSDSITSYDLTGKQTWSDTLADLAPDAVATATRSISIDGIFQVGDRCYLKVDELASAGVSQNTFLAWLNGSCVGERVDGIGVNIEVLGTTFWSAQWQAATFGAEPILQVQQVDPNAWQAVGPVWDLSQRNILLAGQQLWSWGDKLELLDISPQDLGAPSNPALPCSSGAPSASPSDSPVASPS